MVVSYDCAGMERSLDVERSLSSHVRIRVTGNTGLGQALLLKLLFSWLLGPLGNIGIYGYFLEGVFMFQFLLDFKF